MNNTGGALSFNASINDGDFNRTIDQMTRKAGVFGKKVSSEADQIAASFNRMAKYAAGAFAGLQLAQLPAQIVKVRGEFQQLEIALNTMLQSKSKADQLMAEIVEFAAKTPYGLKDTASAAKQLLAYGESAENVIDTLRRLGDIASGIGAPLGDIAYLYGTTMTQGRLYTQDLNQFLGRGIPMIKELAKIFNVAEDEVKGLVEAGKVGFPEVQKAIENLTSSGSMFGGLMEAQSKSLLGLEAALGDAVDSMLNDIGKSKEGILTTIFETTIAAVENYEKVVDVLKVVIATYGAYRAALMLTAAIQAAPALIAQVKLWYDLTRSIKSAKDAQILFNLVSKANPYVLVATALTGIISAFVLFNKEATKAERAQNSLNEAMKKGEDAAAAEQAKIQVLTATINNEAASRYERNKALEELIRLSPDHLSALTLENIKTEEGVTAINNYIDAKKRQLELQEIERELQESIERQNKAKRNEHDLPFLQRLGLSAASSFGDMDYNNAVASERRRFNNEIVKSEDELQAKFKDRIAAITGIDIATNKSAENTKNAIVKTIKWYEEEIKALRDKQSKASTRQEFDAIEKEIKKLELEKAQITGEQIKASAKSAAETEKELRIKTFRDELAEKRHMYELYERWVSYVGKEAADEQFNELLKGGESYMAWLNNEIKRLEQLRDFQYAGFTEDDKFNLDWLLSERSQLQNKKTGIDLFRENLENAKEEAASLVDYLEYLRAIERGLQGDDSILGSEKRIEAAKQRIQAEKELKADLEDFLRTVEGSEEKRAAIEEKYQKKRRALENLYNEGKIADYKKALAAIDAAEKKELDDDEEQVRKKSAEYKALLKIAEKQQNDLTKLDVEAAREQFKRLTENLDKESDEYKEHYENLLNIEKSFQQKRIEALYAIGDVAVQIGDVMRGLDGDIGNVGNVISAIGSQVIAVAQTIEKINRSNKESGGKGKFNIQDITSIISLITQLVGLVVNRVKMLGDEFENFIISFLKLQSDQSIQRNDRLGRNYSDNPFLNDYSGMIKAGVEQYQDALSQFNQAIAALDEGNAITGYRGGFWRSKKKRFITSDLLETYPDLIDSAGNLNRELAQTLINTNMIDDATKQLLENAIAWSEQIEDANSQMMNAILDMTGMIGNDLADAMVNAFKAGEDGAKSMSQVIGGVIESLIKNTVLLEILRPIMDDFNQGVKDSLKPGGDGTILDDLAKLNGQLPDAYKIAEQVMNEVKNFGAQHGIPIFESSGSDGVQSSVRGHIEGATEKTVSLLVGQFNAVRIYNAQIASDTRTAILHLADISYNTSFNKNLVQLSGILDELKQVNRSLNGGRSLG